MSPTALHEILIALFRERPSLATELLRSRRVEGLPEGTARPTEAAFTQIAPAEFHADLVLEVGEPVELAIVVEVQLRRDKDKPYVWPLYACALRERRRCDVVVLVLAPGPAVARWAARPIRLGPGASTFEVQVIGPESIPAITSVEEARAAPELAVLSVVAHGKEPDGLKIALAAALALEVLPPDTARLYYDFVLGQLPASVGRALEDAMKMPAGYELQSEWARKHFAEGKAEGKAEGRAEGQSQEACRIVLGQLVRRVGMLGPELQAQVESLAVEQLEALSVALLDFQSMQDLHTWLASA